MQETLRWGILATGFIAGRFAEGLASSRTGKLHAVASRSSESAAAFARRFGGSAEAYGSLDALLADPEVDAVYIATPHPAHASAALAAIAAGKRVLCEKPLGMSAAEVRAILDAARASKLLVAEAYMYRCHPQTAAVCERIREGAIGAPKLVQASFGFRAAYDPRGRLFDKEQGGGAILDVGGYPASFACLVADLANGGAPCPVADFAGSVERHPETAVDTLAAASLRFANGLLAQISVATRLAQENAVRIFGEDGWIEIGCPWIVAPRGGDWSFRVHRAGAQEPETVRGREPRDLYGVEADHFAALAFGRPTEAPGMDASASLRVADILDRWQAAG